MSLCLCCHKPTCLTVLLSFDGTDEPFSWRTNPDPDHIHSGETNPECSSGWVIQLTADCPPASLFPAFFPPYVLYCLSNQLSSWLRCHPHPLPPPTLFPTIFAWNNKSPTALIPKKTIHFQQQQQPHPCTHACTHHTHIGTHLEVSRHSAH